MLGHMQVLVGFCPMTDCYIYLSGDGIVVESWHILGVVYQPDVLIAALASSPGHTQIFQRMHKKSRRAWYQKSRDLSHDRVVLHSQMVSLKLELFKAIRSLHVFILCLFRVYNDRTSTFYTCTL